MSIDVSVLVVNWNTRDLLLQCVGSVLADQDAPSHEVIVVDNASSDGSVSTLVDKAPQVNVIRNARNVGFARANNQALAVSRGRYVMLLNSDARLLPGAMEKLVAFADAHPEVGMAGPRLLNDDCSLQPSWASDPSVRSELLGLNLPAGVPYSTRDGSTALQVDWLVGACILVRRSVVEEIGGLDEGFFMYSEDTDWCYRARERGWAICHYPGAEVVHVGGQSSRMARRDMRTALYVSKAQFVRKHYRGWRQAVMLAILAVRRRLPGGVLSRARAWRSARNDRAEMERANQAAEVLR